METEITEIEGCRGLGLWWRVKAACSNIGFHRHYTKERSPRPRSQAHSLSQWGNQCREGRALNSSTEMRVAQVCQENCGIWALACVPCFMHVFGLQGPASENSLSGPYFTMPRYVEWPPGKWSFFGLIFKGVLCLHRGSNGALTFFRIFMTHLFAKSVSQIYDC